jgi:hypothetical protein
MVMQSVMFLAQSTATATAGEGEAVHPLTAAEVWEFCAGGFAGGAQA